MGKDGEGAVGKFRAGGQTAADDQHLAADGCGRRGSVQRRNAAARQIVRQRLCVAFLGACQYQTRHPPCEQILQILAQEIEPARPHGQLAAGQAVQRSQRQFRGAACKGFKQYGGALFKRCREILEIRLIMAQLLAKLIAFQQRLDILLQLPFGAADALAHLTAFGYEQQRVARVIQHGRSLGVNKR